MTLDLGTEIGRIRVMIGDTDESDQMLTDAMIAVYATGGALAQASEYLSAAACADAIAAKLSQRVTSFTADGATFNWGSTGGPAKRYLDLADRLRKTHEQNEETNVDGLFDWAEFAVDDFSARERLENQILRGVT